MYSLGLDISTSCTGLCVLDGLGNLALLDSVSFKSKNIFEKSKEIRHKLEDIKKSYQISSIYVEENLQAFRPGLSSAKTLIVLARFNGIVSQISYDIFEVLPEYINVNSARKSLGIKIISQKKCGKPTKEQVFEWVDCRVPNYSWPTKKLKRGPRSGLTILDPSSYDMADAYVIAAAGNLNNCT